MKKRILSILMALALVVGLLPTAAFAVDEGENSGDNQGNGSVGQLSDKTSSDSTANVTRAQFAEIVYSNELLKKNIQLAGDENQNPNFSDVSSTTCTEAQIEAINALYRAQIISGTSTGKFEPNKEVTRGEGMLIIWRAAGSRSNKTPMANEFTDEKISPHYLPVATCFYAAGLISGEGGSNGPEFNENGVLSVAEANAFISRFNTENENYQKFMENTTSGAVTRAEMTVEFYDRFQQTLKDVPTADGRDGVLPFTDLDGCTDEQKTAIEFFYRLGIISGTDTETFTPHGPVSNFQLAKLLQLCAQKEVTTTETASLQMFRVVMLLDEDNPFQFLSENGANVTAASTNQNAPALTADLNSWANALAPAAPTFSPEGGTYTATQSVTINAGTEGDGTVIYYITGGSTPTVTSTPYTGPITIDKTTTINAIAVKNNLVSDVATATYTINTETETDKLTITASPTSLSGGGTVTLTVSGTVSAVVSVSCSDSSITPTGNGNTWTATLPNATATYTFTASADGYSDGTCTVSVTRYTSSGGNTGSGSSSSGTTVSDPDTSGGTTTVTTEVKPSTSGTTSSATVSQSNLDKAVDSALQEADRRDTAPEVTISVDVPSRADSVQVTLPAASLETLGEHSDATLTITSDVGEVTLDSTAITSVAAQAGTNVTVAVAPVDPADLNDRQQTAVGEAPVYDLSIKSGNRTITDFDGSWITVSLPYDLADGRDPDGVVVYYLDDRGGRTPCDTRYSLRTRMATFTTRHFSKYVIDYEAPDTPWEGDFADVSADAWYYDAVRYVHENGLMSGVDGSSFAPDATLTRAMVAQMLYALDGKPHAGAPAFADVAPDAWYADAVAWASTNHIVSGVGEDLFAPDSSITREQLALMLYQYAWNMGYDLTADADLSVYADGGAVSPWAQEAMGWAVAQGLMGGTGGDMLSPGNTATRAQIAVMLMRFCQDIAE